MKGTCFMCHEENTVNWILLDDRANLICQECADKIKDNLTAVIMPKDIEELKRALECLYLGHKEIGCTQEEAMHQAAQDLIKILHQESW